MEGNRPWLVPIYVVIYNVPYLKVLDEVGHADTALAEEEPDTCKVESTSEQESVFG